MRLLVGLMRQRLLLLLVVTATLAALPSWYTWWALHNPVAPPTSGIVVSVPAGASFRTIAARLARAGVLRHPVLLSWWARLQGADRAVQSGEYWFSESQSPLQILARLQSTSQVVRWVTVPEGLTAHQIASLLEQGGFGGRDVFLCAMDDPELRRDFYLPATGVEGYLFPDTYAFDWAMEPDAIVRAMLARFRQEGTDLAERRVVAGLTETEMVTLASVIEKETQLAGERALVSGVFHNRLRLGMPLQADPTVLYGRGEFGRRLTRADLAHPSPYNTYVHRGLPAGPIANPGRAALEAAIAPAETEALYFVSRNDGSHQFSASLAEHNRAVRRYQRRRRATQ